MCECRVDLKLGGKRRHHAAHQPSARCPVTRPETALHLNVKCHLAAQLEAAIATGDPLQVVEQCFVGQWGMSWDRRFDEEAPEGVLREEWLAAPCAGTRSRVWLEGWDAVKVELRLRDPGDPLAGRIPDIVLLRDGEPVAAIEVFHTHAVDARKAEALAGMGVPWLEVRAEVALVGDRRHIPGTAQPHPASVPIRPRHPLYPLDVPAIAVGWTVRTPLPVHRQGPEVRWRCPDHTRRHAEALVAEEARRRAEAAEAEARREATRYTRVVRAAKVVDLLYPAGTNYRHVYQAVEVACDGQPHQLVLERDGELVARRPLGDGRSRGEAWRALQAACRADVAGKATRTNALVDSPMAWATGACAEALVAGRWRHFLRVPLEAHYPLRYRFNRRDGRWFVPPDLRDVRWDRAPTDTLETAHPAWFRGRPSVAPAPVSPIAVAPLSAFAPAPHGAAFPSAAVAARRPAPPPDRRGLASVGRRVAAEVRDGLAEAFPEEVAGMASHPLGWLITFRPHAEGAEAVALAWLVVDRRPDVAAVMAADEALHASGCDVLWLAKREHWSRALSALAWLPLVPAGDGRLGVPVDGWAVALPDAAPLFRRGEPAFTTTAARHRGLAEQLPQ